MGFFVTWLEGASAQFAEITVLALRVGRFSLPKNVTVIPLRPTRTRSKLGVIVQLLKQSFLRRQAYDGVFVRGDPHYVVLAGWLWRLLGKKIIFWYAHWRVSAWSLLASAWAHVTVTSVKAAYNHPWVKPVLIGQNIDARRFPLRAFPDVDRPIRYLVFGRIMPVKQVAKVIEAFIASGLEATATLTIGGPATDPAYAIELQRQIKGHTSIIWDARPIPYDALPAYLGGFDVLVNAYAGSLDKTIVESAMTGLVTIAATDGMSEWLAPDDLWLRARTSAELVDALQRIAGLPLDEREHLARRLRERALARHTLDAQIARLVKLFETTPSSS